VSTMKLRRDVGGLSYNTEIRSWTCPGETAITAKLPKGPQMISAAKLVRFIRKISLSHRFSYEIDPLIAAGCRSMKGYPVGLSDTYAGLQSELIIGDI
jgi:hypothetical protein